MHTFILLLVDSCNKSKDVFVCVCFCPGIFQYLFIITNAHVNKDSFYEPVTIRLKPLRSSEQTCYGKVGQIAPFALFISLRYLKYKPEFLSFLNFIKQNKTKNQERKR